MILKNTDDRPLEGAVPAVWMNRLGLVLFMLFVVALGGFIAGVTLHDPDTCWLVATGRYMVEHVGLPGHDPFSYTLDQVRDGQPMVLYQWLTEVILYLIYAKGGPIGLILLVTLIVSAAFLVLPMRLLAGYVLPTGLVMLAVVLGAAAGSMHFLCRPEIFSYLLFSIWLLLLNENNRHNSDLHPGTIVGLVLSMILWCNLHSGFVIGLILLSLLVADKFINRLMGKAVLIKNSIIALLLCLMASLINPWGIRLWFYLPHLFFAKTNAHIVELQSFDLASLKDPVYFPFYLLLFMAIMMGWRKRYSWFSLLVMLFGIVSAFTAHRLIPFAALSVLGGLSSLKIDSNGLDGEFRTRSDESIDGRHQSKQVSERMVSLVLISFSLVGAILIARIVPPRLPQDSPNIHPAFKAIEFLCNQRPSGNLFNDPEFGDMMILYMGSKARVFIDSRFDLYGYEFIHDYQTMESAQNGWRGLLDKYNIGWLFLPPGKPICTELMKTPGWTKIYGDERAVVLVKDQI